MPETMMAEDTGMGMDDSLYAGDGSGKESAAEDSPESIDEENAENPTALIPTSALGGKAKVGDSVMLKVVAIHDDEAEVEIASSKEMGMKDKPEANDELDSMSLMNKGGY